MKSHHQRQTSPIMGTPRAPVMITPAAASPIVEGNNIWMTANSNAVAAIVLEAVGTQFVIDASVSGNQITLETGGVCTSVIKIDTKNTGTRVHNNYATGAFKYGIFCSNAANTIIQGNIIRGASVAASVGVNIEATAGESAIQDNTISGFLTGIARVNSMTNRIADNYIADASIGIELFGTTATRIRGNTFDMVTTPYANAGAAGNTSDTPTAAPAIATGTDAATVNALVTTLKKFGILV